MPDLELRTLLDDFERAAAGAPPPPPASDLDAARLIAEFESASRFATEPDRAPAEAVSKEARESVARFERTLLDAGTPPTRLPMEPPLHGTRAYLHDYTRGLLDLSQQVHSEDREESLAAAALRAFTSQHPRAFDLARASGTLDQLDAHLRVVTTLNRAPPTPTEILDASTDILRDWQRAAEAGRLLEPSQSLTAGFAPQPAELPQLASVSPGQIRQIAAKIHALGPTDDARRLLTDEELAAYEAVGAHRFRSYLQANLPAYVAARRWSLLRGQPLSVLGDEPIDISSTRLSPDRFNLTQLAELSPYAAGLIGEAQNAAVAQAQQDADLFAALKREKGNTLGTVAFSEQQGATARGEITAAGLKSLGVGLNLLTLGAFPALTRSLEEGLDAAGSGLHAAGQALNYYFGSAQSELYRPGEALRRLNDIRAAAVRRLASSGEPALQSEQDTYALLLQRFPNLPAEDKARIAREFFTAEGLTADRFAYWAQRLDAAVKGGSVPAALLELGAKAFWLDDPGVRQQLSAITGGLVDAPADLMMAALTSGTVLKLAGRRLNQKLLQAELATRARLPHHIFSEFDTGGLTATLENRTRMLEATLEKIHQHVPDQAAARELVTRLQDVLMRERLPLDATTQSWVYTAAEELGRSLDPSRPLDPPARAAFERRTAQALTELPFGDAEFIITGQDPIVVNRAYSADLARRTRAWLTAQERTDQVLKSPRRITGISRDRALALQRGVLDANARLNDNTRRLLRTDEILSVVEQNLQHRSRTMLDELDHHERALADVNLNYNAIVAEQLDFVEDLDRSGGVYHDPNPVVGTPIHRKLGAALRDPSGDTIARLALSSSGRPNRRLAQAFGGPELARLLDEIHTAGETQLTNLKEAFRRSGTAPDPAEIATLEAGIRRKLIDTFQSAARQWYDDAFLPVERRVPAVERPDLTTPAGIRTKLASAAAELVELEPKELAWLNRHARGEHDRLPPPSALRAHTAQRRELVDLLSSELDALVALNNDVQEFRGILRTTKPDQRLALKVPARLRKAIDEYLADPAADIFDTAKRFTSISRPLAAPLLKLRDAWADALRAISQEEAAVRNEILDAASVELHRLPANLQAELLRDHQHHAQGLINTGSWRAAKLSRIMDEEGLTGPARTAFMDDLRSGRPRNDRAFKLFQDLRLSYLEEMLRQGQVTPEFFEELSGLSYYHGVYPDKDAAARLKFLELSNRQRLPPRFSALRVDPKSFRFKLPEDSHWVAWEEKGQVLHKSGFASPDEAATWISDTLKPGARVSINKPFSLTEKKLAGLFYDPASQLPLIEQLALHTANYRFQYQLSKTPYVRTAEELLSRHPDLDLSTGEVRADGQRWLRVDNKRLPHLHGQWISAKINDWLTQIHEGYDWFRAIHETETPEAQNELLTFGQRAGRRIAGFASKLLGRADNMFVFSKVALSPRAYRNGWMTNIFTADMALGGTLFTPSGMSNFVRHTVEGFLTYLDGNELWDDLRLNDNIHDGRSQFVKAWRSQLARHKDSLEAVERRLADFKAEYATALRTNSPDLAARLHAEIVKHESALSAAAKTAYRGLQGTLRRMREDAFKVFDTFAGGETALAAEVWNFYQLASGDVTTKYAVYKTLLEQHGLSRPEALKRVDLFLQHLHRTPKTLKVLGRAIGGAKFASFKFEQARIFANALRYEWPLFARNAAYLGAWNHAALAANGVSSDEWKEFYAHERGLPRSALTDTFAMLGSVISPAQGDIAAGGIDRFEWLDPIFGAFGVQSPLAQRLSENLGGDSSVSRLVSDTVVSAVNGFLGGSTPANLFGFIIRSQDPAGDPIRSPADYLRTLWAYIGPDAAPGNRDWNRFWRAYEGRDIDPRTLRTRGVLDLAKDIGFLARASGSSIERLNSAVRFHARHSGKEISFERNERFDDVLSTLVARGAYDPATRTFRTEDVDRIVREYYDTHPVKITLPGGRVVADPKNRDEVEETIEALQAPVALTRFNRLNLKEMLGVYLGWRKSDPNPDPTFHAQTVDLMLQKARSRPLEREDLDTLDEELAGVAQVGLPRDALETAERLRDTVDARRRRAINRRLGLR